MAEMRRESGGLCRPALRGVVEPSPPRAPRVRTQGRDPLSCGNSRRGKRALIRAGNKRQAPGERLPVPAGWRFGHPRAWLGWGGPGRHKAPVSGCERHPRAGARPAGVRWWPWPAMGAASPDRPGARLRATGRVPPKPPSAGRLQPALQLGRVGQAAGMDQLAVDADAGGRHHPGAGDRRPCRSPSRPSPQGRACRPPRAPSPRSSRSACSPGRRLSRP